MNEIKVDLNSLSYVIFWYGGYGGNERRSYRAIYAIFVQGTEEKPIKTIWYNMRQEPVIYVNGTPYAPRNKDK